MQNAPARQPRVGPAAPRTRRAWVTPTCLVGAALIAGAVTLPPFAAGTLFPSRGIGSPAVASRAVDTVAAEAATPSATLARIGDKPEGAVETRYSDLPLATEPANEPPRGTASEAAAGTAQASGTLTTGVFASRPAAETGAAAEPPTELALQPIPPIGKAAAPPIDMRPTISSPPARREPLPLQTDLLPMETPGQPAIAKPGPGGHG